jgi:lipopolysaccharide export system permease protein
MVAYFAFKIPAIASQMLPPATLTTVIILFSLMKRNNEMVALKASGFNTWQVARPLVLLSAFFSIALFLFSETIVPYATSICNEIWRVDVKKENPGRFHGQNHVWYKGKNCIYFIRQFDNRQMMQWWIPPSISLMTNSKLPEESMAVGDLEKQRLADSKRHRSKP